MLILPAIDLLNGKCVRLRQGAEKTAKVYSSNPPQVAQQWQAEGGQMIHVVNLDGAFGRAQKNVQTIRDIVEQVDIPIELGGGIRSLEDIRQWLAAGVHRVILGTVALEKPEIVAQAVQEFGAEHIVVGIDGRDQKVAIKGWEEQTDTDVVSLARKMKSLGAVRIIYTDVRRDGELVGPNIESTNMVAEKSGMKVIASGGFSTFEHFEELAETKNENIEGAIIGTALYENNLKLCELLQRFGSDNKI